jgi:hypothetical protein
LSFAVSHTNIIHGPAKLNSIPLHSSLHHRTNLSTHFVKEPTNSMSYRTPADMIHQLSDTRAMTDQSPAAVAFRQVALLTQSTLAILCSLSVVMQVMLNEL